MYAEDSDEAVEKFHRMAVEQGTSDTILVEQPRAIRKRVGTEERKGDGCEERDPDADADLEPVKKAIKEEMKGHFWYQVPLNTKSDHRAFPHRFRFTLDREWLYPPGNLAHKAHGGSAAPTGINFQGWLCGRGRSSQPFLHDSSTDASSIAARRQKFKGGKEKPQHVSAALRYLTRQQEMAKQCADHMVLLDDAVQRLEKEERWHTETSAQHGAPGIKHAVNISKIVEAMGTLRDEWTRVQKLIQNDTSDSA